MSNTFTQIHIHCVFAVKFRQSAITPAWKERLHKYITGIIQNNGHKMIAINSMPDHVHLFIGFKPNQSLSDLMRIVKGESSEWINKENLCPAIFRWQEGYAAFSFHAHKLKLYPNTLKTRKSITKRKPF
jgi:REP element-mobilizing transposase RayT